MHVFYILMLQGLLLSCHPLCDTFQGDRILGFDLVYLILLFLRHFFFTFFPIAAVVLFLFSSLFAAGCVGMNILLGRQSYNGLLKKWPTSYQ